ncbi:pullulanase [Klebsiella pneumoniae]|uniref:Pullulanase n=1 Tax=Klebsiella pneumoniae TaxID=573 RepID=A0A377ZJS5_KLEPN|nr:pullulanase [Klebsiella pneumoniae]
MTAFYQELTALRKSSPLFTLGDGATVMKRVDFRNTGADQQTGLLVMTIDDGMQAGASLDSRVDGIVGGDQRRAGKPDAAGLRRHIAPAERYSAGGGRPVAGERRAGRR